MKSYEYFIKFKKRIGYAEGKPLYYTLEDFIHATSGERAVEELRDKNDNVPYSHIEILKINKL